MTAGDEIPAGDGPEAVREAIAAAEPFAAPSPSAPPDGSEPASSRTGGKPGRSSGGAGGGKGGDARGVGRDRRLAKLPLTDLGNAERFVDRYRESFLWCPERGWLGWDGKRWNGEAAEGLLALAVYKTVRAIRAEAKAIEGTADDYVVDRKRDGRVVMYSDRLKGWAIASESANRLACIARLAAPYLEVAVSALDVDPFAINVENGTIRIVRGAGGRHASITFGKHNRGDRITKIAPVAYDPAAECPIYDRFLEDVQPDEANRRFLHQWGGYSLTGDTSEQRLVFFYGKGKNGKSTLVDTWALVAGDYSETVPIETFLDSGRARNAGAPSPELAILPGVRLLRTSEPEKGAKLAEALIKLATGGEPLLVRHLNRPYFKLFPAFKLTISGNYRPSVDGTDEGIWRRLILVPWLVTIADAKRDKHLGQKLRAELAGILNRLLDGLCDWLDYGLVVPAEVAEATASYRTDSDPCGRFLEACVRMVPGGRVQSSDMHALFCAWAKVFGEKEWSPKGLAAALKERGFRNLHSNVMWWLDCQLIKGIDDLVDFEGKPRHAARED